MRFRPWLLLAAGPVALALAAACDGGRGGGGAALGTTSTTTTTDSASSSPAPACDAPAVAPSKGACVTVPAPPACPHPDGGVTDAGDCSGLVTSPDDCTSCAVAVCCAELQACAANAACWSCLEGTAADPTDCETAPVKGLVEAAVVCEQGCCADACGKPPCNPVTNAGCDAAAGQACDYGTGGFKCYDPPNDGELCGACDDGSLFCGPGLTCAVDEARCFRFCCEDGDCGGGRCDKGAVFEGGEVGVCVAK